jgi:hypothetical protein
MLNSHIELVRSGFSPCVSDSSCFRWVVPVKDPFFDCLSPLFSSSGFPSKRLSSLLLNEWAFSKVVESSTSVVDNICKRLSCLTGSVFRLSSYLVSYYVLVLVYLVYLSHQFVYVCRW